MSNITAREFQVAGLISHGETEKEIGNDLRISVDTVRSHKRNLFNKTGSRNIADLTRWFIREKEGILHPTKATAFTALAVFTAIVFTIMFPSVIVKAAAMLSHVASSLLNILK